MIFPPQGFHGIFSSALRAETYSENIAPEPLRLLSGQRKRTDEISAANLSIKWIYR
jgi:hypothetical protein